MTAASLEMSDEPKLLTPLRRINPPPPFCKLLIINEIKSLTVKLLPLVENFFYSNFASV